MRNVRLSGLGLALLGGVVVCAVLMVLVDGLAVPAGLVLAVLLLVLVADGTVGRAIDVLGFDGTHGRDRLDAHPGPRRGSRFAEQGPGYSREVEDEAWRRERARRRAAER